MVIIIFMRYKIFGNKTILVFMFRSETILVFWIRLYFKIVQFPADPTAILYVQWHKSIEDWNKQIKYNRQIKRQVKEEQVGSTTPGIQTPENG